VSPSSLNLCAPGVSRLVPYDPGLDALGVRERFGITDVLELSGNESHWGPSPQVRHAIASGLDRLAYYPDPSARALKAALADRLAVNPDGIVIGNGSHELLVQIGCTLAGPGQRVIASRHGFAVFAIAALQAGAELDQAQAYALDHPQALNADPAAMLALLQPQTRLIYLANPNNPTGGGWNAATLRDFLARVPAQVIVVVDEAYAEFVDAPDWISAVDLLPDHPNLIVTRTFSKAFGLAALRLGYALMEPGLAAILERTRLTFNGNDLAQRAALAALSDEAHLANVVAITLQQRGSWQQALAAAGLRVYPSQGNFLLLDFGRPAAPIFQALAARGVLLRPLAGYGLPNCLRITIADEPALQRVLAAYVEVLPLTASEAS
jgi:histidinol-phosphate aminotransferase